MRKIIKDKNKTSDQIMIFTNIKLEHVYQIEYKTD